MAYVDWKETFDALPDDKAGMLVKHIFAYVSDENPETDDILIKAVFANIKQTLKRDLKKWESTGIKRADIGRLGGIKSGEARQSKMKQNEAIASKSKQNEANEPVSVNVSDSVNDNVTVKEEKKKIPTLEEIKKYCLERKNKVDAEKFFYHYESNGWMVGKNKMKNWKSAIITWEKTENKFNGNENNSGNNQRAVKRVNDLWK